MAAVVDEVLLSVDEFESLGPGEQRRYLELLRRVVAGGGGLSVKQRAAWWLLDRGVWSLLYGGAAGGGKTEFVCRWVGDRCFRVPGFQALVLRQTLPQVRATVLRRCLAVFSAFDPPPRWKSQERVWEFANGSLLWLGFLQYEADAYQYLSQEFDAICVDEASQLIPEGLALLETRLRTTKSGVVPQLVLASNPGGPGHRSLLERFPVVPKPGDEPLVFEGVEVGATRELRIETPDGLVSRTVGFVSAKVGDNPWLDKDYVVRLSAAPERMRRMYMDGDWSTFEGQFFSEFNPDRHVEQFEVPDVDRVFVGIDFGWASPFAAVFFVLVDNQVLVFDEVYRARVPPEQQAALVLERCDRFRVRLCWGDPSAWNQSTGGLSVAAKWAQAGLPVVPGVNARVPGWQALRTAFASDRVRVHPRCSNLIRELVDARTGSDPEDLDHRCSDHALDALRYAYASAYQVKPRSSAEPSIVDRDIARIAANMRR